MEPVYSEYIIREERFSYRYRAEGYDAAIAKWLKATFSEGCTATEPDNFGSFQVNTPKRMIVRATIARKS